MFSYKEKRSKTKNKTSEKCDQTRTTQQAFKHVNYCFLFFPFSRVLFVSFGNDLKAIMNSPVSMLKLFEQTVSLQYRCSVGVRDRIPWMRSNPSASQAAQIGCHGLRERERERERERRGGREERGSLVRRSLL